MDTTKLIKGLHHVTATVNDAQEDYDFYTKVLGLRLVKKTVNFDNNQVYHFYYGTEMGTPGTIMTTFPYKGQDVRIGTLGTGQVAITGFSIPISALDFWKDRLQASNIEFGQVEIMGNPTLRFQDPAGLFLELVANDDDDRAPWTGTAIPPAMAIRGFYNVTLSIAEVGSTFEFLEQEFGFTKVTKEGMVTRYQVEGGGPGRLVDIRDDHELDRGKNGIGTVHHVAWRVESDEALHALRARLVDELGLKVTEIKDRKYFHSIYFRIPGGVLFEVATIPPGFSVDESLDELGNELKLPDWEEANRTQIESVLPKIN
ncbi:MAG: ring-cleaving dioxygenase [Saprospiraceae bacterium]|nr:ring-cleaving dioxygenase [Saprospiraceae bacterium]